MSTFFPRRRRGLNGRQNVRQTARQTRVSFGSLNSPWLQREEPTRRLTAQPRVEGCEDSNNSACRAGINATCSYWCHDDADPETCEIRCRELAFNTCDSLYPNACQRCVGDCNESWADCQQKCEACVDDPDSIDCYSCMEQCRCQYGTNCRVTNCRSLCESTEPGLSALKYINTKRW